MEVLTNGVVVCWAISLILHTMVFLNLPCNFPFIFLFQTFGFNAIYLSHNKIYNDNDIHRWKCSKLNDKSQIYQRTICFRHCPLLSWFPHVFVKEIQYLHLATGVDWTPPWRFSWNSQVGFTRFGGRVLGRGAVRSSWKHQQKWNKIRLFSVFTILNHTKHAYQIHC